MARGLRFSPEELDAYEARGNDQRTSAGAPVRDSGETSIPVGAVITPPVARAPGPRPVLRLKQVVVPESVIKDDVLKFLRMHRKVAWAERLNVAAGKLQYPDGSTSQFMRFGWVGCSDIIGQTVTGRFLAVETKIVGKFPTADQYAFLELVKRHGGVAFVARDVRDAEREMGAA